MKRLIVGLFAVSAFTIVTAAGWTQPPEGKGKGSKDGNKGDKSAGARFELGRVLPPFMRERLELTADQKKQIDELEKEVKERLNKILTDEQKRTLERAGGPGGEKGTPEGKGKGSKGKDKSKDKDGPPPDKDGSVQSQPGIQWFATLERGRAEAERTGMPILFVSAAPHCGGISGMW